MKIRKWISAFCLAAGLALSVPAFTAIPGTAQNMTTVRAAEELKQDANGVYCEKDGVRVTNQVVTINGKTYYFNAEGYRVTGAVQFQDATYFFHPTSGALVTGYAGLNKVKETDDFCYYFNDSKNGSIAVDRWVEVNGKYFYADPTGVIHFGTITVNNQLYHVTPADGRLTSYKCSSYDGKYYYASASGVLKTGLKTISGKRYYFDPLTGARVSGTVTVGNYTYYFTQKTGASKTGWVKLDGKYYYHSKKTGRRLYGFRTIGKYKYYLNPDDNGARATSGWYKVGSNYRYFNANGVQKTGFITTGGKTYYAVKYGARAGVRKTGWMELNGRKYYFSKTTGVMKTGWFTSGGKKYYLNPVKTSSTYGAAKTGWVKIKSYWYYFNKDGTMRTGWFVDNMKKYYLDKTTGRMLTGTQSIDGKTYNLGKSGALEITGDWLIRVNRKQNCITIYRGNTPVKAMICSTALAPSVTPTGTFKLLDKLRWHELMGPSWGQYCSHIPSDILFHSVTYTNFQDNHSLFTPAYNNLGNPASHGCIRLQVIDAKWLYDNCPIGTKVIISDSEPMPLGKPTISKIPANQNYDPTDPNA